MPRKAKAAEPLEHAEAVDEIVQEILNPPKAEGEPGNVQEPEADGKNEEPDTANSAVKAKTVRKKTPKLVPKANADLTEANFTASQPLTAAQPSKRQAFYGLNFRQLDKGLSPDEQREWNAIYASYRAGSILSGKVAGVDSIKVGDQNMVCLVVFDYRVKVLIPQTEVWADETSERPVHVLRRFLGAEVDYIIREVDREGECAVASRKLALQHRQKHFRRRSLQTGDLADCRVLAVSATKLLVECGGYETALSQNNISYGTILDLRTPSTTQTVRKPCSPTIRTAN